MPDLAEPTGGHHPGARDLHGLIRLAGLCVAIPVEAIREVVPCPARLDPFPPTHPDVIGALELRNQVIPVIDLGRALGSGNTNSADIQPIIVILRIADKVLGVRASAIDGVAPLAGGAIECLSLAGPQGYHEAGLVRASFNQSAGGEARRGVVLDVSKLAAMAGMPLTADRMGSRTATQAGHEPTLMFTVGGLRCGLPASCVAASLPWQELSPAPVDDPLWIAMLPYKGGEIPAIDTLQLLGHGAMPVGRRSGSSVVVRAGTRPDGTEGVVALLIDTVDDIVRLRIDQIQPLLHADVPGSALASGIVQAAEGPCLMIDDARLVSDPRLVNLGGIEQTADREPSTSETGPTDRVAAQHADAPRKPHLVFNLGSAAYAVQLDMVEAILPYGQDLVPLPDHAMGFDGMFAYRGQAVPLIDLGRSLNAQRGMETGFVVVTREAAGREVRRAGFRVDALCSVERVAVQQVRDPQHTGAPPAGLPGPTIRLDTGQACPVLDLPQMLAGMLAGMLGEAA